MNLTSLGGSSGGVYTTTISLKRGAQSNIEMGAVGTSIAPEITQTLDRWGNILAINDPRDEAFVTTYRYDYANHQLSEVKPEVTAVDEHGTETTETPTTLYFYDSMGHVVKVIDAAGGIHKRTYDASGNVKTETEADGGITHHYFDLFGREVATTNALGYTTSNTYDLNNRLVQELRPLGLTHTYTYDQEGNRLTDTNAFGEAYRYKYDLFGHVIDSRLPMWTVSGATSAYHTSYTYDLYGNKLTEENELGDDLAWSYGTSGNASAYFHRARTHTDMGATVTTYTYDTTGHIVSQTSASGAHGGQNLTYEYYADGKLKIINDLATHTETYYEYDALGNKTRERFASTSTSEVFQDTWMTYDAIGRVIDINDYQRYHLTYKYDISGNRRNINSIYTNASNVEKEKDYWYEYDAMNRITLAEGVLNTSTDLIEITSGSDAQGTRLYYDAAGQRAQSEHYSGSTYYTERYQYDENGKMRSVWRQSSDNGFVLQASHQYDAAGRETLYERYDSNGNLKNGRYSTYNANGWLTAVTDYAHTGAVTKTDGEYTYDYAGNITNYDSTTAGTTTHYTYTYDKWDSYKEKRVVGTSPEFNSGKSVATYDVNGNLIQRTDENDDDNTKTYQSTLAGEILKKTIPSTGKVQYYYYADGKPVGSVGDLSDATFDYNYTPVSGTYPGTTPGQYTVSDGDTLESVATAAWGDSSLWYLIADANGLDGTSTLVAGQVLTLPNTITNIHNNSNTFTPYNPSEIIGSSTPTMGGYKCSGGDALQVIVAVVIAAIVTYFTGGAGAPMLVNALKQGQAMADGKQNGFNWGSYAVTGIVSAMATQLAPALEELGAGAGEAVTGVVGEGAVGQAAASATSFVVTQLAKSAVTQGLNIATGMQEGFSWNAVAVSTLAAGINGTYAGTEFGQSIAGSVAQSLVTQSVRIAIDGQGRIDWLEVAADAFGNQIAQAGERARAIAAFTPTMPRSPMGFSSLASQPMDPFLTTPQLMRAGMPFEQQTSDAEVPARSAESLDGDARSRAAAYHWQYRGSAREYRDIPRAPSPLDKYVDYGLPPLADADEGPGLGERALNWTAGAWNRAALGVRESSFFALRPDPQLTTNPFLNLYNYLDTGVYNTVALFDNTVTSGLNIIPIGWSTLSGDSLQESEQTIFAAMAAFPAAEPLANPRLAIGWGLAKTDAAAAEVGSGLKWTYDAAGAKIKQIFSGEWRYDLGEKIEDATYKLDLALPAAPKAEKFSLDSEIAVRARLPRTNGRWEGEPGNGLWHSTLDEVNTVTGGDPIRFINGRPDFSPWSKGQIVFEKGVLDGTQNDFKAVYQYVAEQKQLQNQAAARVYLRELELTPHHVNDTTIQLVPTKLHANIPHVGSAAELRTR